MTWLDVVALALTTAWVVWFITHVDGRLLGGRTRPNRWRKWRW